MRALRGISAAVLTVLFLIIWTAPSGGRSIHDQAGTGAFSFLRIGIGARAAAMGGAYVSLCEDASALYWNPAGLTQPDGQRLALGYVNYLLDIQSGFLGYVLPPRGDLRLGAAITYFSYGEFQQTTVENPSGTGLGTFGAMDMALSISGAYPLEQGLSVGASAKIIYSRIEEYSSDAYALDVGALYPLSNGRTRIGASIQNLGFQRSGYLTDHTDGLAPVFRLGASHRLQGLPLLLSADLFKPLDHHLNVNVGGEFLPIEDVSFRLGWSSLGQDQKAGTDRDNLAGFSGGLGVGWQRYRLDYAYSSQAELGDVHRATLSLDL
jgi:hypothetical protein